MEFSVPVSERVNPRVAHYLRIQLQSDLEALLDHNLAGFSIVPGLMDEQDRRTRARLAVVMDRLWDFDARAFRRRVDDCLWNAVETVYADIANDDDSSKGGLQNYLASSGPQVRNPLRCSVG